MKFCPNCGTQLEPGAAYCFACGAKIPKPKTPLSASTTTSTNEIPVENSLSSENLQQPSKYDNYQTIPTENEYDEDTGSIAWGVIGFLLPLIGLILFLIWHRPMPKNAKLAGMGALIGCIVQIILFIILVALSVMTN